MKKSMVLTLMVEVQLDSEILYSTFLPKGMCLIDWVRERLKHEDVELETIDLTKNHYSNYYKQFIATAKTE